MENTECHNKINVEQVKLLYQRASFVVPFNLILISIMILYLWSLASTTNLLILWSCIAFISLARYIHIQKLLKSLHKNMTYYQSHVNQFCLGAALSGIFWSYCFWLYSINVSANHQYFFLLILGCLAAGSIVPLASVKKAYLSFVLPLMLGPFAYYLYHFSYENLSIIVLLFFYMGTLLLSYMRSHFIITRDIKLKLENQTLVDNLIHTNEALLTANKKIAAITHIDELTQLKNRRFFNESYQLEWKRAKRHKHYLGMMLMDIDYFKDFNDEYGHLEGDKCLQRVASIIQESIKRSENIVARFGGEEFVAILPYSSITELEVISSRIINNIEAAHLPHKASTVADHVTLSIGAVTILPRNIHHHNVLLAQTDAALYEAKDKGRNCFVARTFN